ncbi:MAG TPA: hypothetical protein PKC76_15830 [Saprospiraceae bacterium]|nr:hypothetical protein [Saprospiraceae bacterium]HMP25603.1 hypothetical protein [Saprospiraceae bacterium]
MRNETHIEGTHNIVIQGVTESTLTLNVNGEVQEIRNELSALRTLLESRQTQTVQYADKIYNIAHIDEANFGFMTGRRAFNEALTRQLIESIQPYSLAAKRFLEKVASIADWEHEVRFSNKAKEILAYSFVGVLGIQLSKLMAIGKEDFSDAKQRKYIAKCIEIARYATNLLCVTLLSKLWDEQRQQPRFFSRHERQVLEAFFQNHFESSLPERLRLLQVLDGIFAQAEHALPLPLEEWHDFRTTITEGGAFATSIEALAALQVRIDRAQYNLLDCVEAENQLTVFLSQVAFLTRYRMASIRHIGYWQPRNADARYLHRYTALGIDNKAQKDAEKINCTPETVQTDAVLLYRDDNYSRHICLSPFLIDYNALTFEHGPKICFFLSQAIDGDILEYVFHEDGSVVRLEKQGILKPDTDLNELMLEQQKQKILNLDNMVSLFHEAHACLLGAVEEIDFEDL